MTVNSLTPNLMVDDVEGTVEWYERVFDADLVATLPSDGDDPWWAQVIVDDVPLMFQERASLEEKLPELEGATIGSSAAFYIDVDDARRLCDDLESAGAEIAQPPHETEQGWRQFVVADCNGYLLWFGERVEEVASEEMGRGHRIP